MVWTHPAVPQYCGMREGIQPFQPSTVVPLNDRNDLCPSIALTLPLFSASKPFQMTTTIRTILGIAALISATSTLHAQDATKEGYALTWTNSIGAVPDTLMNGNYKLAAYRITIFESDGGDALDLWKTEMKTQSKDVSGSKPMKAMGAMVPSVSTTPIMVVAEGSSDKKAEQGILKIAYAVNDSVALPHSEPARQYAYDMAVKLNKAVVQQQLDSYSKTLDKSSGKLESAQNDVMKNDKNLSKANKALAKATEAISKYQANNADYSGRISGLERKFATTNDPKDLKDLTKMRQKLASSENKMAGELKSQAKAEEALSKYQGNAPDEAKAAAEREATNQANEGIINALKAKQNMIH